MGHELVSRPSRLKNKHLLTGLVAAVAAGSIPAANAAIELGEGISVTGFVDQSFTYADPDGGAKVKSFGIDQVETDFLYTGSNGISAEVDIEYGENASDLTPGDDTFVEQAFVTKSIGDMFTVKLGRFLSYSGWETEEPTGLFQYSGSGYAKYFYGYYQQGVSASYNGGMFSVMGSLVNDVFGFAGNALERNTNKLGYELGVAVMPVDGLTAKLFYMSDEKTDQDVINFWASYSFGGFTLAAEYNDANYAGPGKGDGYLAMANYAMGPWGATLRYSSYDIKAHPVFGFDKVDTITVSPSYKVGDNLLLVGEFRADNNKLGADVNTFAFEALFTF